MAHQVSMLLPTKTTQETHHLWDIDDANGLIHLTIVRSNIVCLCSGDGKVTFNTYIIVEDLMSIDKAFCFAMLLAINNLSAVGTTVSSRLFSTLKCRRRGRHRGSTL